MKHAMNEKPEESLNDKEKKIAELIQLNRSLKNHIRHYNDKAAQARNALNTYIGIKDDCEVRLKTNEFILEIIQGIKTEPFELEIHPGDDVWQATRVAKQIGQAIGRTVSYRIVGDRPAERQDEIKGE